MGKRPFRFLSIDCTSFCFNLGRFMTKDALSGPYIHFQPYNLIWFNWSCQILLTHVFTHGFTHVFTHCNIFLENLLWLAKRTKYFNNVLPPTRKKVAFVFFCIHNILILGKCLQLLNFNKGFNCFPWFG